VRGEPIPTCCSHYRPGLERLGLTGQVVHGGRKLCGSLRGLQNALVACGGVPRELRHGRLFGFATKSAIVDGMLRRSTITPPATKALCALYYHLLPAATTARGPRESGMFEGAPWAMIQTAAGAEACCCAAAVIFPTSRPNTASVLFRGVQCPQWPPRQAGAR